MNFPKYLATFAFLLLLFAGPATAAEVFGYRVRD